LTINIKQVKIFGGKMKLYEGKISGEGKRFGIIVSRFNGTVTERLLEGAIDCLIRHNADSNLIEVFKVPGSFEIPQVLKLIISDFDAIICLAALIRGETPHFDFLSTTVTREIERIAVEHNIPVAYGIITADTLEQAINRAGGKQGNKGFDAALSVMEQIGVRSIINERKKKSKGISS
jgi:6,7-dimethyl-8-ribityllumazine synthase